MAVQVILGANALCACKGFCTCKTTFGYWCLHGNRHIRLGEPLPAVCSGSVKEPAAGSGANFKHPLCLRHVDQPSQEGDAALYFCAAKSSAAASWGLLLPCDKATRPVDSRAGPNPHSSWALRQEAVRKDRSGAIINTGCTANPSLQTI